MKRRDFVKAGTAAGAVFSLGITLTGCGEAAPAGGEAAFAPDAWIRLFPDGTVLVEVDRSEMGQKSVICRDPLTGTDRSSSSRASSGRMYARHCASVKDMPPLRGGRKTVGA